MWNVLLTALLWEIYSRATIDKEIAPFLWGCFEWLRHNNELQVQPACHVPHSWSAAAGLGQPAAAVAGEVLMWKVAQSSVWNIYHGLLLHPAPRSLAFPENDCQATGIDYVQLPTNYGELQQPSNLLPNYY